MSRITSGALTAVAEQTHQFGGGNLDLALEAGDVFGQGLLDLVELGFCPGSLRPGGLATTWDSSVWRACLDVPQALHAHLGAAFVEAFRLVVVRPPFSAAGVGRSSGFSGGHGFPISWSAPAGRLSDAETVGRKSTFFNDPRSISP